MATPTGLLGEGLSILRGNGDKLTKIAHEAKQVLDDLMTEADAVATLLAPVVQAAEAAAKAMGQWAAAELEQAADVAQVVAADTVNALASLGNAALHNPMDVIGMVGGAALMAGGAGIEIPGVALDATGVGALLGIPVNAAGVAMMATGGTMAGAGALDLAHEAEQHGVIVMNAHTGRPGEGVDRGDGRDPYGNFTGRGGYGKQREAEGIKQYQGEYEGRWFTREQRKATVDGADNGRFHDGLARKPDGTYEGIEVKSGTAGLDASQRAFEANVKYDNPGYVTITNEQGVVETVKITSTRQVTVPAE